MPNHRPANLWKLLDRIEIQYNIDMLVEYVSVLVSSNAVVIDDWLWLLFLVILQTTHPLVARRFTAVEVDPYLQRLIADCHSLYTDEWEVCVIYRVINKNAPTFLELPFPYFLFYLFKIS